MFPPDIDDLATEVLAAARKRGWKLATAESCTGGLVSGALTDIAGSSDVIGYGFVTYANAAKVKVLGVSEATLAAHGAVSGETARQMATGALAMSGADAAVAITGVAGPGGGSAEKPVGLVWFACATRDGVTAREERFGDLGRTQVRLAAVRTALGMLKDSIGPFSP